MTKADSRGDVEETVDRVVPTGRDQTPDDMGRLAVFFGGNGNVTGQAVAVDGGVLQNDALLFVSRIP